MILPDLVLLSRANQRWQYSGIDSPEHCLDKKHFLRYPHSIDYVYNSRGFRDAEWPDSMDELRSAIWCLGDSYTVGIGQPLAHTWPSVLSAESNRRTINVSMDGASNDWIYRRALNIISSVDPVQIAVMWSYTHRRESHRVDLTDDQRRIDTSRDSVEQDYAHWVNLSNALHMLNSNIIQLTIPDFHAHAASAQEVWTRVQDRSWPPCPQTVSELEALPTDIVSEITNLHQCYDLLRTLLKMKDTQDNLGVIHVAGRLDWARDHHHFDILTAQWVVQQILDRLCI